VTYPSISSSGKVSDLFVRAPSSLFGLLDFAHSLDASPIMNEALGVMNQPSSPPTFFLQYKNETKKHIRPKGSADLTLERLHLAFFERFRVDG
jgi:hypothetical protein